MSRSTHAVVDASALAALCFVEEEGDRIAWLLRGRQLHAPVLLFHELTNVAWKKTRRAKPEEKKLILDNLQLGLNYAVQLHDVPYVEVLQLALHENLTIYDAAYFWLAQRLDATLVTLDKALQRKAGP